MIKAAVAGEACFEVDDLELHRPPPSFTIDTMEDLRQRVPEAEFFYFIGSDNLARLDTWHRIDELRRIVNFVLLRRGMAPVRCDFPIITRHIDISATEIRNRVASGRSVRYLVPRAVKEIIRDRGLYQERVR
jgi:nicotinate-nucleotide adenylyltransferase